MIPPMEVALLDKRGTSNPTTVLLNISGAYLIGSLLSVLSVPNSPPNHRSNLSSDLIKPDSMFGISSVQAYLYFRRFQDSRLTQILVSRRECPSFCLYLIARHFVCQVASMV